MQNFSARIRMRRMLSAVESVINYQLGLLQEELDENGIDQATYDECRQKFEHDLEELSQRKQLIKD